MVAIQDLAPPWMPAELIDAWHFEYLQLGGASIPGSATNAAEVIRSDTKYRATYDSYFPGNRRDDGSLRLSEQDYRSRTDSYENALIGVDVNPDLFRDKFAGLISGDVAEAEFTSRVESMYDRVISSSGGIRDFYAANYGVDLTDNAIVASFLDPDVGNAILDKRIAVSEIGGEAAMRKFNIDLNFATELEQAGVTRTQSQDLFGQAAAEVPVFQMLAARHADPDDTFDLNEFTQAAIFDDPTQRRRMRRLVAQERATFSSQRGALAQDRAGQVTGLNINR